LPTRRGPDCCAVRPANRLSGARGVTVACGALERRRQRPAPGPESACHQNGQGRSGKASRHTPHREDLLGFDKRGGARQHPVDGSTRRFRFQ
jgi:hypothetical protein